MALQPNDLITPFFVASTVTGAVMFPPLTEEPVAHATDILFYQHVTGTSPNKTISIRMKMPGDETSIILFSVVV